jgi:hypothetical protein
MLIRRRLRRSTLAFALLLVLLAVATGGAGCESREKLRQPRLLTAPYERPQVWAVAPFANESGVSIVRSDRIADLFAHQAEDVNGIAMIPVNRVIYAMQQLQMRAVATPAEAATLMNVLGVDGLIVGTITAYDPYPPLKLGVAVQLYRRDTPTRAMDVDPLQISRASTEVAGSRPAPVAVAQVSGIFDASNHQTLAWLDEYATGRAEPDSAYGKRIYQVSMEMYTQFVAYRLLHDLLAVEQARLQPPATQPSRPSRR